jgi:hypothetical protein
MVIQSGDAAMQKYEDLLARIQEIVCDILLGGHDLTADAEDQLYAIKHMIDDVATEAPNAVEGAFDDGEGELTDAEADAMTLASAGMGTDEDYGGIRELDEY